MKSGLSIDDDQQRTGNQACSSRARVDEGVAPSDGFAAVHESVAGTLRECQRVASFQGSGHTSCTAATAAS